jgi:hypothetical protein
MNIAYLHNKFFSYLCTRYLIFTFFDILKQFLFYLGNLENFNDERINQDHKETWTFAYFHHGYSRTS